MAKEPKFVEKHNEFDLLMLSFIDAYLIVHGTIGTPVLMDFFGIARSKASSLFKKYLNQRPTNMRYEFSIKAYKKGIVFTPDFLVDESALNYLNALDVAFKKFKKSKGKVNK
ncbi:hypothetical protein ACTTZI_004158 [Vibrio vulnificus]